MCPLLKHTTLKSQELVLFVCVFLIGLLLSSLHLKSAFSQEELSRSMTDENINKVNENNENKESTQNLGTAALPQTFPVPFWHLNRISFQEKLAESFKKIYATITLDNHSLIDIPLFSSLETGIYALDPKAKIYLGPDLILKMLSFIYANLYLKYQADHSSQKAKNNMTFADFFKTQAFYSEEKILNHQVFPPGSEYQFVIEASSKALHLEIKNFVSQFMTNIQKTYKKLNPKPKNILGQKGIDESSFPLSYVVDLDEHMLSKRKYGGSTLDFLLFDLNKKSFVSPQDYDSSLFSYKEDIVKNFMEGHLYFTPPQDRWTLSSSVATTRIFKIISTLLELPFLSLENEQGLKDELLFYLKTEKFDAKALGLIKKEHAKMLKSVRLKEVAESFQDTDKESLKGVLAGFLNVLENEEMSYSVSQYLKNYKLTASKQSNNPEFKGIQNILIKSQTEKFQNNFPYNKIFYHLATKDAALVLSRLSSPEGHETQQDISDDIDSTAIPGPLVSSSPLPESLTLHSSDALSQNEMHNSSDKMAIGEDTSIIIPFNLDLNQEITVLDLRNELAFSDHGTIPKHKGLALLYIQFLSNSHCLPGLKARDRFFAYLVKNLDIGIILSSKDNKTHSQVLNTKLLITDISLDAKLDELVFFLQDVYQNPEFTLMQKLNAFENLMTFLNFPELFSYPDKIPELKLNAYRILRSLLTDAINSLNPSHPEMSYNILSALITFNFKKYLKTEDSEILDSYLEKALSFLDKKNSAMGPKLLSLLALEKYQLLDELPASSLLNIFMRLPAFAGTSNEELFKRAILFFSSALEKHPGIYSLFEQNLETLLEKSLENVRYADPSHDTPTYLLLSLQKIFSYIMKTSQNNDLLFNMQIHEKIQILDEHFSSHVLEKLLKGQGVNFYQGYTRLFELFKKFYGNDYSEEAFTKFLFSKKPKKKESHRFTETVLDQIFFSDKASFHDKKLAFRIKVSQDLSEQRLRFIGRILSDELVSTLKKIESKNFPDTLLRYRDFLYEFISEPTLRPFLFDPIPLSYFSDFFQRYKNKSDLFFLIRDIYVGAFAFHLLSQDMGQEVDHDKVKLSSLKGIGEALLLERQLEASLTNTSFFLKRSLKANDFLIEGPALENISSPFSQTMPFFKGLTLLLSFINEGQGIKDKKEIEEFKSQLTLRLYVLSKNFIIQEFDSQILDDLFLSQFLRHSPYLNENAQEALMKRLELAQFSHLDQIKTISREKRDLNRFQKTCSSVLGFLSHLRIFNR